MDKKKHLSVNLLLKSLIISDKISNFAVNLMRIPIISDRL